MRHSRASHDAGAYAQTPLLLARASGTADTLLLVA
jgi:hypothetical protein